MCLKSFRIIQGLNQKGMAERIGVSPSYYYKVEAGNCNPSFGFLAKLKNVFPSVCIDEMFFDNKKSR